MELMNSARYWLVMRRGLADLDAAVLAGAEQVVDLVPADVEHVGDLLDGEFCLILPPSERTCRRLSQDVASRETLRNRKVINTKSAR